MAKKNSSKTATEKAIQSSEPKVVTYRGWKGVNYADAPLDWNPLEGGKYDFRQTDLPANYLMVQNNLITTPTLGIETRPASVMVGCIPVADMLAGKYIFTGIATVYYQWLFAVVHDNVNDTDKIWYRSLLGPGPSTWDEVKVFDPYAEPQHATIKEIGFYEGNMMVSVENGGSAAIALGKVEVYDDAIAIVGESWNRINGDNIDYVSTTPSITNPAVYDPWVTTDPVYVFDWPWLEVFGMNANYSEPTESTPVRLDVIYCYVNRMGSTLASGSSTVYVENSPALWSSNCFLRIHSRSHGSIWSNPNPTSVSLSDLYDPNITYDSGITGIDFYARENENVQYVFIGHIDVTPPSPPPLADCTWEYDWLGNMTDTTQWINSQPLPPTENTTRGPNVTHFTSHDSRLYYWGHPEKPYRLYIGGDPGAEFSIARGLGGAWIDIEPGSGYEIAGTAKWKTSQGANIVTILCGNRNTSKVKRFNLVETNITFTNEISGKSYMYEEVSNVVGCNSRYGYGVYTDGLYCLSRYGLMLTTMTSEYNNQMKTQSLSDAIKPIFTERLGDRLRDGRMVCIDDVIYIALSEGSQSESAPTTLVSQPPRLDRVIFCYDVGLQTWYTFTDDTKLWVDKILEAYIPSPGVDIDEYYEVRGFIPVDSDQYIEGLGSISGGAIVLHPIAGYSNPEQYDEGDIAPYYYTNPMVPEFTVLLETGELMPKMPMQTYNYIQQLEFRFDYLIGDPDDCGYILVEGVDYYGRPFSVKKWINLRSRGNHGLEVEQRNYVEWIRIEKICESLRVRIMGHVRFRLTHINARVYTESDRIATPYGFDAKDTFVNRRGEEHHIHHYINDYDNLRRALVS